MVKPTVRSGIAAELSRSLPRTARHFMAEYDRSARHAPAASQTANRAAKLRVVEP